MTENIMFKCKQIFIRAMEDQSYNYEQAKHDLFLLKSYKIEYEDIHKKLARDGLNDIADAVRIKLEEIQLYIGQINYFLLNDRFSFQAHAIYDCTI